MRANQDLKNTRDFGEHAAEGGNICGIDEYTKEGGDKRDFGEHATEGGNKRNFGEHATIDGNKRDLSPPMGIRVILATMQQDVGTSVILENNFKTCNKRWDATFRVRNQRKGWQPARAALAGNATLMEHSLGDQTALTNGLDQRP